MADQEQDYSSLPLEERFQHKVWKVRKDAYEAAAKEFDNAQSEADPTVRQFTQDAGIWKGAVADSNAAAHQEALSALCSFLQIAGTQGCIRTRNLTITPLAEKGLIATKPAAKQKALEAILLYVELDKAEPVIDELLPSLSHKLPKIVAATLSAFTAIYHQFGTKTVDPKPVLKSLPKVFGHADKNVRAEAQGVTVELYRWLRESMKPLFWDELKPVQQQDLEKLFEQVKSEPAPKPERLLRSQQAALESRAQTSSDSPDVEAEAEEDADNDHEPEMMTVDVFPKIPKDLQDRLASSKWKDRKDALDDLHTAVNAPAIDDGPFDDIMRALAKCMKDTNIGVVTAAAQCVELLARGLRKSFAKYRATVFVPILERLKERKQSVTDALAGALDGICAATGLSDNLEQALEFLSNKNPQIKLETTKFLARNLKATREAPSIPETKLIADAAAKTLADSQETQRNAGAEVLGVLWKIMGDRVMNTHLEGLDDIRKAKIREYMENAEVKSKYKPKAAPAPKPAPAAPPKKPAGKRPVSAVLPSGTAKKPVAPAAAPVIAEEPVSQPQPQRTARPGAMPRPTSMVGAPRGLRPPTNIGAPGKKLPAPAGSGASLPAPSQSPSRRSGQQESGVDVSPPPAVPKAGRGLTGRTLAKPSSTIETSQANQMEQQPVYQQQPSIDQVELDALRNETSRLRTANEQLRAESSKLTSQVYELQNQNAQLIEDHTRDVLNIKAKETQLVRARSDAETAETTAQQLTREVERLKRELGRIGRASSPRASDLAGLNFSEGSLAANALGGGAALKHSRVTSPSAGSSLDSTSRQPLSPSRDGSRQGDSISSATADQQGRSGYGATSQSANHSTKARHQLANGDGNAAPAVPQPQSPDADGKYSTSSYGGSEAAAGKKPNGAATSDGVESWKRAAEVTQNLKARIEMMKARQAQQQARGR